MYYINDDNAVKKVSTEGFSMMFRGRAFHSVAVCGKKVNLKWSLFTINDQLLSVLLASDVAGEKLHVSRNIYP